MKRLTSIAAAAALSMSALSAQAFEICFDGFADGMDIQYGADLNHGGQRTGIATGNLVGNLTFNFNSTPFPAATIGQNTTAPETDGVPGRNFIYLLNYETLDFCNYESLDGSIPVLFLCGTFSFGPCVVGADTATTTSAQ